MRLLTAVTLLLATASVHAAPIAPADPGSIRRVRADVEFLASDGLEGRDTGSKGYGIAADYVASQFRAIGLEPGGENGGWFQQVPFRRASFARPPVLSLGIGGQRVALEQGKDVSLRPSVTEKALRENAGFVFVGYGLKDARYRFDDYRGLNLKGKIAVALEGTPNGLPSEIEAHLNASKAIMAAQAGAVGVIEVSRKASGQGGFRRAGRPVIDWVDSSGRAGSTPPGLKLRLSLSEEIAGRLFEGAPRSLASVRADAKGPRGFALRPTLSVDAENKWEDFTSPEVIGMMKGSDPTLAAEHVVLMGHLDHLGMRLDGKPGEDVIYNGALDIAAGVATMLEAARLFAAQPVRPKRSVIFIANTGEERGLLGADYYANHPTVPASSIVGLVDLDMPLLLYPFTDVTAFGAEHSTVGAMVAEAGASMGISVAPDPMPEEAIFTRSDHYMFVRQGVPAVLLMTGHANGGKEIWNSWLSKIYHSPQDDLKQAINWDAGARYADLNYRIARAMADAPVRPMWLKGDYFGETFAPGQPRAERQTQPQP